MIHLYRVTLRTPRDHSSLLSLKNITSVALLPGSHCSWPGDGTPGPRSLPLPAAGHAAQASLPRLVVFAGKAMVIANLLLTFCFHSVANARNTEPSSLNASFLAQAPNEVPPLCQTKAPIRRTGGGRRWCCRGKPRKCCLCGSQVPLCLGICEGERSPCR